MGLTITPDTLPKLLNAISRRLDDLENTSPLGASSATAGTSKWKDGSEVDQVVVGLQSDGSYGVWLGSGGTAKLAASGTLSLPDHSASNVPTCSPNGVKIWVQATDPGGAAANGDIWINTT